MKTVQVEIGSTIFNVQEGLSYVQQNALMNLIEEYVDLSKMQELQVKQEEMGINDIKKILKKGIKLTTFTFELSKFFLLNIVKNPKLTKRRLNNPDDPLVDTFYMLGAELSKLGMKYLGKLMTLKKTPKK